MIGRSLMRAIAPITWRLKSFGTVLTPMIPVGRKASIASTKELSGACSGAKGFRKSAISAREAVIRPLMPVAGPALRERQTLERHRLANELGDAGRRRSAAKEKESLFGQLAARDAQRRENPGQRDRRRALNVV